jgi:hypothetical protein
VDVITCSDQDLSNEEATMAEQDPEPDTDEPEASEEQEEEKLLDDLEPEEEEAAGVEGGQRVTGRWHGRRM